MSIETADNILEVKNSTMRISRIEVGQTFVVGNVEFESPQTLASVSNTGNTTPYTIEFTNPTTSLVTSSNVDVKGVLNHTQVANVAQITSNSNVVMEYKLSTRDYEEVAEPRVAIDNTLSVGGYTVSASSTFNSGSTGTYGPWGAFNKLNDANGWSSDGHGGSTDTYSTSDGSQLLNVQHHTGSALGEWIQLDMPYGILLKSVDIQSRNESSRTTEEGFPKNVYLYGSTNNSTWSLIKNFTAQPKIGNKAEIHNEPVSVQVEYKHFALVTNNVYVGAANFPAVGIGEIRYYGTRLTANVPTGTDVVLHTTPNVPKLDFSNVYYDGQDYTSMPATVADKSGNGVTGTPSGGVGFDTTYKAFTFDGVDDQITATLTNPAGAWVHSASMWFKVNSLSATNTLFSMNTALGANKTPHLVIHTNGNLSYGFSSNDVFFGGPGTIVPNKWYHLSVTYSGGSDTSSRKVFLNSVELGISSTAGTISALDAYANSTLKIGTYPNGTNPFNGSIANFRLDNNTLSADEIWELYAYQKEYFGVSPDVVTLKAGRVGIGTSEPRAVLDVRGDIRGGCPVFFQAHATHPSTATTLNAVTNPIPFNTIVHNKGGGLQPSGVFTCPLAGYYYIVWWFMSNLQNQTVYTYLTINGSLELNGTPQSRIYGYSGATGDIHNQVVAGGTVYMNVGDELRFVFAGSTYMYISTTPYNSFTGFYISS
jgi:hypothetical protein